MREKPSLGERTQGPPHPKKTRGAVPPRPSKSCQDRHTPPRHQAMSRRRGGNTTSVQNEGPSFSTHPSLQGPVPWTYQKRPITRGPFFEEARGQLRCPEGGKRGGTIPNATQKERGGGFARWVRKGCEGGCRRPLKRKKEQGPWLVWWGGAHHHHSRGVHGACRHKKRGPRVLFGTRGWLGEGPCLETRPRRQGVDIFGLPQRYCRGQKKRGDEGMRLRFFFAPLGGWVSLGHVIRTAIFLKGMGRRCLWGSCMALPAREGKTPQLKTT